VQKPLIAATRGVAVGMGFSMALAADLIVASQTTRFSQIQRKIALPPDAGGAWFLVRQLGVARAKELAFSARMVGADEALALGLVHKVVADDALMEEALALAREYASGPTIAFGLAKRMFDAAAAMTLDDFMDLEGSILPLAVQADDFKEGTQAFKDKRSARFTGH
jgi:2-(1,2-epoxy-1,2-dihydrophenyl)acetyl-CoA isomerase